jgi:hypothetical protein
MMAIASACLISLLVGYWIGDRNLERRAHKSGRRQFQEFLVNAIQSGVVQIDEERLADLATMGGDGEASTAP